MAELNVEYLKHDPANTILAGFSFGAMTAFVAASQRNPSELWLFSLSSYFKEDVTSIRMKKSWLNNLGHRRVTAFSTLHYKRLASNISCKVLLFSGQVEIDTWPIMKYRTNEAPKYLEDARLTVIADVGHNVADPKYITAISKLLRS